MKNSKKVFITFVLVGLILNLSGMLSFSRLMVAQAETVAVVLDGNSIEVVGVPGETVHVNIPVKAIGGNIDHPRITVESGDMPFIVENIGYTVANYESVSTQPTWIPQHVKTTIGFDLRVKETATLMSKPLVVKIEGTYHDNESKEDVPVSSTIPNINFVINREKEPAQLTINDIRCENAIIGGETNLSFTIKNEGELTSYNTYFSITNADFDAAGIIPGYTKIKQEVAIDGELAPGDFYKVNLPVSISPTATEGNKTLTINIEYKDKDGVALTTSCPIYIKVKADSESPKIEVDSTKYASELTPGDEFSLVVTLRNKGIAEAKEIEVVAGNLGIESFIPNYTTEMIKAGNLTYDEKVDVKIPLIVSKDATKGLKEVPITINYKDSAGIAYTTNSKVYIEVIKKEEDSISKPKLIISNFSTGSEELRAGSTFDFNFDIKNTHSSATAKNIKVTVSQAENIFTLAEGSNSFYITKIPAGQVAENNLKLKVKADAVTKTYPLEITMEYEYDGAVANPTTGEIGETVKETIVLQAVENSRAVVNNIFVGTYSEPIINQPATLTFEFYNMGKSPLNNVRAMVEGDFTTNTDSLYMGNFEAGASDYPEIEVIPTVEGLAKGTLIIIFEDSNGDEVKVTKEFEATVQGEMMPDMSEEVMGDNLGIITENVKKPILPVWLFIVIQFVIVIIGIPVSRKIKLSLYRRKLRKQEEAQ